MKKEIEEKEEYKKMTSNKVQYFYTIIYAIMTGTLTYLAYIAKNKIGTILIGMVAGIMIILAIESIIIAMEKEE